MLTAERLSIKARVRLSILALVVSIVLALSVLHLYGVIGETLEDAGERALVLGELVKTYVVETANRAKIPQAGASSDQIAARWREALLDDPVLPQILQKSLTHSQQVIEIVILDDQNRVLASSDPRVRNTAHSPIRSYADWQHQSLWSRVNQIFRASEDFAVSVPLGYGEQRLTLFTVRVLISSVLLRATMLPKLRELVIISAASLLMSLLLAFLVSNLVSRSIEHIGADIDRITKGETGGGEVEFESPELITLQTKLAYLGRQFRGVREDVLHLRSNIDQMLKSLEEAILVFGPDGRLQMAGEPAVRLLAKNRSQLLGRTVDDLFPHWMSLGVAIGDAVGKNGSVREKPVQLDRPNMPSVRLLLNVEPIDYGDGRAGTLVTLRDAESQKQIRSQIDTATRLSSISRLAAGVAHEIKNPLNAIMLHLQIACDKADQGVAAVEELEVIKRELLRLDRVVKTFLDFNRPLELHLSRCDLAEIVQEIATLIEPEAARKSVRIVMASRAPQAIIEGDCDLIKQCLLNIAINGLEATKPKSELQLSVDEEQNEFIVAIKDEGDGIPAEIQDKIFNLYFTTKPSGTGIGLAIAYRVVQLHSGTITFETEAGKGTCFRLKFPVSRLEEVAA